MLSVAESIHPLNPTIIGELAPNHVDQAELQKPFCGRMGSVNDGLPEKKWSR